MKKVKEGSCQDKQATTNESESVVDDLHFMIERVPPDRADTFTHKRYSNLCVCGRENRAEALFLPKLFMFYN